MKKRGISLLLLLMMAVTLLPFGTLAATSDNVKQYSHYVCIGDSIAAGYGSYAPDVRGFEIVPAAYHSHVANATGATVASLAHTGMRSVEVRWLLDDAYSASQEAKDLRAMYFNGLHDVLNWMEMTKKNPNDPLLARYADKDSEYYIRPNTRATLAPYCKDGAFGLKNYFRQNIEKADLCTVALGLNDIFLYAMKQTSAQLDDPNTNLVKEVTEFVRCMTIGQSAFKTNWAPLINKIKEYNKNIEIVVVGMYNPFSKVKAFSSAELVPIGKAAELMVNQLNSYMKEQASTLGYKYADVSDTEIENTASNSDLSLSGLSLFEEIVKDCHPTETGHQYIANQILEQLPESTPAPTASPTITPSPAPLVTPSPSPLVTPSPAPVVTPSPKPVSTNPFTDVSIGKYYYEPVLWAVETGVTNGTTKTTFSPNATCTRGQIVTFLWRAEGGPKPSTSFNPFQDIKPSDYYYEAVLWAVETGITNGVDAKHFAPSANCTRAQAVTFLWRAEGGPASVLAYSDEQIVYITTSGNATAYHRSNCSTLSRSKIKGITLTEASKLELKPCKVCKPDSAPSAPNPQRETVGGFNDVFVDQYFAKAVLWAVKNGITNGIDATHFGPDNPCTRGQIVTFLYRDLKK